MKKLVKVLSLLALSVVVCLSIVAFAACSNGTTYEGEYHYNAHNHEYGMAVKVTVADGKITKVEDVTGDKYVSCSAAYGDWTEDSRKNWSDNLPKLLKAYEGKTVEEVKAATSSISGQDGAEANAVSDSSLKITDATQGSARLLKAVQNALKNVK